MAIGAADRNRTRVCAVAPHGSAIELRTRAQSGTRTCEARRHLIYSQASLPLEYLCVLIGAGNLAIARTTCWRKADDSNATPCGARPFSRRGAGHSSGTFRVGRLGAI